MNITIKEGNERFGVRAGAILLNNDESKIFVQKQDKMDCYVFPGGRVELVEDSEDTIKRELEEELGITNEDCKLRYIVESFVNRETKYHEIGFYYVVKIDENKYNYIYDKQYDSLDKNLLDYLFNFDFGSKITHFRSILQ